MTAKLYAFRKPWELEPHYCNHVAAMTTEKLHDKGDIAAELAWRDQRIAELRALLNESLAANRSCFGLDPGDPADIEAYLPIYREFETRAHEALRSAKT